MTRVKQIFTWSEFDDAMCTLSLAIQSSGKVFKNIYGVPRGGLVVAVALSHLLDLSVITDAKLISSSTLVVDDISDSGNTLNVFMGWAGAFATIHIVGGTKVIPDFFVWHRLEKWVVYPWEKVSQRGDNEQ